MPPPPVNVQVRDEVHPAIFELDEGKDVAAQLEAATAREKAEGRRVQAVLITNPNNPLGTVWVWGGGAACAEREGVCMLWGHFLRSLLLPAWKVHLPWVLLRAAKPPSYGVTWSAGPIYFNDGQENSLLAATLRVMMMITGWTQEQLCHNERRRYKPEVMLEIMRWCLRQDVHLVRAA